MIVLLLLIKQGVFASAHVWCNSLHFRKQLR